MTWKDYFYFRKQDRVAIIFLLLLIVLCANIYIIVGQVDGGNVSPKEKELFVSQVDSVRNIGYAPSYPIKLNLSDRININKADTTQLRKIPGVGKILAGRIVLHRDSIGGYSDMEQLKEVKGIKQKLHSRIIEYISLDDN